MEKPPKNSSPEDNPNTSGANRTLRGMKRFWESFVPQQLKNISTTESIPNPEQPEESQQINIGISTDPQIVIEFKRRMDNMDLRYEIYEKVTGTGYISFENLSGEQRSELFNFACEIGSEWNTSVTINPKKQYPRL